MKTKLLVYMRYMDSDPTIETEIDKDEANELETASQYIRNGADAVFAFETIEQVANNTQRIYNRAWMVEHYWNRYKVH